MSAASRCRNSRGEPKTSHRSPTNSSTDLKPSRTSKSSSTTKTTGVALIACCVMTAPAILFLALPSPVMFSACAIGRAVVRFGVRRYRTPNRVRERVGTRMWALRNYRCCRV